MAAQHIHLRGVEVHNLQRIDLDLPLRQLVVICGVSGSGKSSLAFDTLYAEGQRRYLETFSPYARQFMQQLQRPAADRIENLPVAVAVGRRADPRSGRATLATSTEIHDHLRLLFARVGRASCPCGGRVRRFHPALAAEAVQRAVPGLRAMVAFPLAGAAAHHLLHVYATAGFRRAIVGQRLVDLEGGDSQLPAEGRRVDPAAGQDGSAPQAPARHHEAAGTLAAPPAGGAATQGVPTYVVVDRLTTGSASVERWRDSLETAFAHGHGRCAVFLSAPLAVEAPGDADGAASRAAEKGSADLPPSVAAEAGQPHVLDGQTWWRHDYSAQLSCERCGRSFVEPEPRLFSFNHPQGACPRCEGFGDTLELDPELIFPQPEKTLRRGAVAPWNAPAYKHELQALLSAAGRLDLRVDVPYAELTPREQELVWLGGEGFGGVLGFFAGLQRRAYKMHVRAYINRFRRPQVCSACQGTRLRPEALLYKVGGLSIADVCKLTVAEAQAFFRELTLDEWERQIARSVLAQIESRLRYLQDVGLDYLTLDRPVHTLSGGEAQRAGLTTALGSSLVNVLYVLDEPSVGLHPVDSERLLAAVRRLCQRGNTVVVVEHEEAFLRAADQVIEIGPGAGQHGGRVVFQGTPAEMQQDVQSLTGQFLSGRRHIRPPARRRTPQHGEIRLRGARGHNLKGIDVGFPLGMLCVVTGVSGSGKSTLVADTLYPAVCRRLRKRAPAPAPYDDLLGAGQVDDCVLVDQTPLGRTTRSNPVTYVKAFDEIRQVFASTVTARTRNYPASFFSFNVEGGRCPACEGQGQVAVDMQFLADVYVTCSECQGRRYRPEVLEVAYRGCTIADVLEMTARQAHTFFRGEPRVQDRLKCLLDVGLDYLRLGQPAATLSGGEAQRLKLAGYLSSVHRGHTLLLLDEPTTGLHPADIVHLLDCFEALLSAGHSLVVVEHNLHLIACADYVIDLGPGAAAEGGRVVAAGTPEHVAAQPHSATGRLLAQTLAALGCEQSA